MNHRRAVGSILIVALLLMVQPCKQGKMEFITSHQAVVVIHNGATTSTVSIWGSSSYDANKLYQLTVSVSGEFGSSGGFSLEVDHGTLSTGVGLMLVNVNLSGNSATTVSRAVVIVRGV